MPDSALCPVEINRQVFGQVLHLGFPHYIEVTSRHLEDLPPATSQLDPVRLKVMGTFRRLEEDHPARVDSRYIVSCSLLASLDEIVISQSRGQATSDPQVQLTSKDLPLSLDPLKPSSESST